MSLSLEEQRKRKRNQSCVASPSKRSAVTEVGMRMLYTEETSKGKIKRCYQALILQDNYNIKRLYQHTACELLNNFYALLFLI